MTLNELARDLCDFQGKNGSGGAGGGGRRDGVG